MTHTWLLQEARGKLTRVSLSCFFEHILFKRIVLLHTKLLTNTSCVRNIHNHDSLTTSIWHFFHFKGFLWSVLKDRTEKFFFSLFANKPAHAGKCFSVVISLWGSWLHIKAGCYQQTVRLSLIRSYEAAVLCISQCNFLNLTQCLIYELLVYEDVQIVFSCL